METFSISLIIQTYWPQIIGLITCVVVIADLRSTDKDQEKRIASLEKRVEDMSPVWIEIRERLVRIETTLSIHFNEK